MINYSLVCENGHRFEAWFRNAETCSNQLNDGLCPCPECGSTKIAKSLQRPSIGATVGKGRGHSPNPNPNPITNPRKTEQPPKMQPTGTVVKQKPNEAPIPQEMMERFAEAYQTVKKVREHVLKNFDNVGDEFATEARKVHYGERDHANIYGQAKAEDVEDLLEEGIAVAPLPDLPKLDS